MLTEPTEGVFAGCPSADTAGDTHRVTRIAVCTAESISGGWKKSTQMPEGPMGRTVHD